MTKLELARQLAQAEGIPQAKAVSIIENILDLIICHFQEGGEKITLSGFGTIKISKRRAYRSGGAVEVYTPAKKSISIKPSAELLRRIN